MCDDVRCLARDMANADRNACDFGGAPQTQAKNVLDMWEMQASQIGKVRHVLSLILAWSHVVESLRICSSSHSGICQAVKITPTYHNVRTLSLFDASDPTALLEQPCQGKSAISICLLNERLVSACGRKVSRLCDRWISPTSLTLELALWRALR